jgi:cysteine synthase A
MAAFHSIIETIGKTPLVRLNHLNVPSQAEIWCKMENFNPSGSLKDRIAIAMIDEAERAGRIKPGDVLIEPTSGNTGISLAFVAAARGYRLVIVMPESMSMERRKLLHYLGAEIVLTPAQRRMEGAVERAQALLEEIPNAFMPQQFDNDANPAIHYQTTANEIWEDTQGNIGVFIAGVGTGGSLCGTARGLKEKNPDIHVIGVEPAGSPVLSGGAPGRHLLQGLGAGFIPANYQGEVVDELCVIGDDEALSMARLLAKKEGLLVGISSGAAVVAALQAATRKEHRGKWIVPILCDTAERYFSTALFDGSL